MSREQSSGDTTAKRVGSPQSRETPSFHPPSPEQELEFLHDDDHKPSVDMETLKTRMVTKEDPLLTTETADQGVKVETEDITDYRDEEYFSWCRNWPIEVPISRATDPV